ncbi:ATPase ASNA1-like protein [Hibiscus syriacus]|uniref:ATPase ASNA1-like protein n=1 Tax=Hibiscus syriacus TaxID=106335 RepID=A0A6A3D1S0_HIBSY|nr:ATPase ASNA1-like protein [Hibiscus syriacus]
MTSDIRCRICVFASTSTAEGEASWCCVFVLVTLVLLNSFEETNSTMKSEEYEVIGHQLLEQACDEIYVVAEGETLHSISDKCGDPFIVEHNPHIHDPDNVFPGLVIKITPLNSLSSTSF